MDHEKYQLYLLVRQLEAQFSVARFLRICFLCLVACSGFEYCGSLLLIPLGLQSTSELKYFRNIWSISVSRNTLFTYRSFVSSLCFEDAPLKFRSARMAGLSVVELGCFSIKLLFLWACSKYDVICRWPFLARLSFRRWATAGEFVRLFSWMKCKPVRAILKNNSPICWCWYFHRENNPCVGTWTKID